MAEHSSHSGPFQSVAVEAVPRDAAVIGLGRGWGGGSVVLNALQVILISGQLLSLSRLLPLLAHLPKPRRGDENNTTSN